MEGSKAADDRSAKLFSRHLVGDPGRIDMRSDHIARIAPDGDDASLRKPGENPVEIDIMSGRLLAHPGLADRFTISGEHGREDIAKIALAAGIDAREDVIGIDAHLAKARPCDEIAPEIVEIFGSVAVLGSPVIGTGHEMRFRGDRDPRVSAEQRSQKRGSGSAHSDDEERRFVQKIVPGLGWLGCRAHETFRCHSGRTSAAAAGPSELGEKPHAYSHLQRLPTSLARSGHLLCQL